MLRIPLSATTIAGVLIVSLCAMPGCESVDESGASDTTQDIAGSELPGGIVNSDVLAGDASGGETAGGDAGETAGGDTTHGDSVGPPEPDYEIGALATIAVCAEICTNVIEGCESHPFPDVETCEAACEADIAADGKNLANWQCAMVLCDGEACGFGEDGIEETLEPDPDCVETCGLVDACGAWTSLDLPPNEIAVCIGLCTGASVADSMTQGLDPEALPFDELLDCIRDSLNDSCDNDAVVTCFEAGPGPGPGQWPDAGTEEHTAWCTSMCSQLVDDATSDDYCSPQTGLSQAYSKGTACMDACMQDSFEASLRWWGCAVTNECLDPVHCAEVPDSDSPPCVDACDALQGACGPYAVFGSPEVCSPMCTGLEMNMGPFSTDAGDCLTQELGDSPSPDQCEGTPFFMCLIPTPDVCVDICQDLDKCVPGGLDLELCEFQCTVSPWDYDAITTCIDGAGADCEAIFECLPEDPDAEPPPGEADVSAYCFYACSLLDGDPEDEKNNGCDPTSPAKQELPDLMKCMEACTETIDLGQAMAMLGCLATSACGYMTGTVEHCSDFPIAIEPGCQSACDALEGTCPEEIAGGPDLCPALCSGATANYEVVSEEDATDCIDNIDACVEDGFGQLLQCNIQMPDFCEDMCDDVAACGAFAGGDCHGPCAMGFLGINEDAPFPTCVNDADEDCGDIAQCVELLKDDEPPSP